MLWCLLLSPALGQTFGAQSLVGRSQQSIWQDRDGLASNTINALARTHDGYLWVGTVDGLARFDGIRFTTFDSNNTPELKNSWITALLEDRAGNLWIGTNGGGLVRLAQGRFTNYTITATTAPPSAKSPDIILCLLEDRAGGLWLGTSGGGLLCLRNGQFTTYTTQDGLPANDVWSLAEDPFGGLWIGTTDGLAGWKAGQFTRYATRQRGLRVGVRALCVDRHGKLWLGLDDGNVQSFEAGRFSSLAISDNLRRKSVQALSLDQAGGLWVGTEGGLFRYGEQTGETYNISTGLPADNVQALHAEPHGELWIGTRGGGLARFRNAPLNVITKNEGLAHDKIRPIFAAADGSVWVGTVEGLNHLHNGQSKTYTTKDGLPENLVYAIGKDSTGQLWFGSGDSLCTWQFNRFTCFKTAVTLNNNLVLAILGDRAGNLWVGTRYSGLQLFQRGQFKSYTTRDGLVDDYVQALYEDRAGNLWIGTRAGVSCWQDGRFINYTTAAGLAGNDVLAFHEDAQGNLWIGTHGGGLSRLRNGQFKSVKVKDGLYDNLAFQMLEDGAGNLWMSCNKGIYRVSLRELNEFVDGHRPSVHSFAYGVEDGMLSRECNGAFPAGAKLHDGKLWFPTVKGIVVIDPQRHNVQPPLVTIESVLVDGTAQSISTVGSAAGSLVGKLADAGIQINPGQEKLEIQYAALSWERPHAIRFKYQLAGLDDSWTDAGTRRTAYFQHLPSGEFTFRVLADNGEGVWNETGVSLPVTVLAPYWRRWWFRLSVAGVLAGLAFAGYQLRVRQLDRARAAQEEFSRRLLDSQESERNRIAAEMHDSLGQSLLIIKNRAYMALEDTHDPEAIREQLSEISESAGQAIEEVREIAYNLRPYQLERFGLTKTLRGICQHAERSVGIVFEAELDSVDGLFTHDAEVNLYRIVQEAVNNIIKHSQATEARLRLSRTDRQVFLFLRDNGRGFVQGQTAELGSPDAATRRGGFGLIGIAERVRRLNGTYSIESVQSAGQSAGPDTGTILKAVFPLPETT